MEIKDLSKRDIEALRIFYKQLDEIKASVYKELKKIKDEEEHKHTH